MSAITLLEALQNKYEEDYTAANCVIYVPKSAPAVTNSGKDILHLPQQLTLNCCHITSCGREEELRKHCSNVTELDLTENELSDCEEIKKILGTAEQLGFLNLSYNPLESMTVTENDNATFPNVNELVLNNTKINQKEIMKFLKFFPKLQVLHLGLNKYTTVALEGVHEGVTHLFFNRNKIKEWEDLAKLGASFPSLENLVLIGTDISEFGSEYSIKQAFPKLKALNLSQSKISKLEEVEKLNHFPSLEEVRITNIPLLEEMTDEEKRPLTIAFLPQIKKLNGSGIEKDEREDAERMLISSKFKEVLEPARLFEIASKHGKVEEFAAADLAAGKKISLTVRFEKRAEVKTFSEEDTIEDVKKQLQGFTQLQSQQFELFHIHRSGGVKPEDMRMEEKTLKKYGVEEGDGLQIEVKID